MFHLDFVILLLVITVNLSQLLAGFVAELLNPISFPGSIQRDTPHQRLPDHLAAITSLLGLLECHKKNFRPEYLLFVL